MANRLSDSNSPYLLQHMANPVDWYPWGQAALDKARRDDKPIFLSIGYAACHWCHVMAHESFEDPEIAAIMNELFVNVKVDREERPDLDSIYMNAVVSMVGQGGWPLSVFLTPDGRPFYGGTYFPPVPRYNMPSFREVLLGTAHAWKEDRERINQISEQMAAQLQKEIRLAQPGAELSPDVLDQAALGLAQSYDWKHGGWGKAPKFPQPMAIEFLLLRASRGDGLARDIASHALRAMAKGGMYDVVAGGFARYSTDDNWMVPHFEKMLYDNAQLALVYLHAFLVTGEAPFRRVCQETLDFVTREMTHPEGGFYSSLDADTEGEEGKFYVWTPAEIEAAVADPGDAEFIYEAYGVNDAGNFEGKNVLQRRRQDEELARKFGMAANQVPGRLQKLHARLLQHRQQRVRPGTDDKVLVAWNGLMLAAFAEAGRYLDRSDYTEMAIRNARFLLSALHPEDRLLRSWRAGRAHQIAFLEDYAALILGLLSLYQSHPDIGWFRSAEQLAHDMVSRYRDPAGGFFDTRDDHEALVTRPKELQDNATPSGNSLAATALLQLSAYTGNGDWRALAESMLASIQDATLRYPTAFSRWLCALDFALVPSSEIAILSSPQDPRTQDLVATIWSAYRPNLVVAISDFPPPEGSPPLLHDRPLVDGRPTAYVCQNFLCYQPVTTPQDLHDQLSPSNTRDTGQ